MRHEGEIRGILVDKKRTSWLLKTNKSGKHEMWDVIIKPGEHLKILKEFVWIPKSTQISGLIEG